MQLRTPLQQTVFESRSSISSAGAAKIAGARAMTGTTAEKRILNFRGVIGLRKFGEFVNLDGLELTSMSCCQVNINAIIFRG
jgi:hypothetical protein